MSERNRDPEPDPLVPRRAQEDVIELVGFVGERDAGTLRIRPDETAECFLDVQDDWLVDTEPLPDDPRGRMRVRVRREPFAGDAFTEAAEAGLRDATDGPAMSVWQFLPENRIVAAAMLGLLPEAEARRYEEAGR